MDQPPRFRPEPTASVHLKKKRPAVQLAEPVQDLIMLLWWGVPHERAQDIKIARRQDALGIPSHFIMFCRNI